MFQITDNPVLDAEAHSIEPDRPYFLCDICGGKIYREDDIHEGDVHYDFDGEKVCEDCLGVYAKRFRARA